MSRLTTAPRRRHPNKNRNVGPVGVEWLEERLLLSGTHDQEMIDSLRSVLNPSNNQGLSSWSDRLRNVSILGRQIPLIDGRLGSSYNPKDQLAALLSQVTGSTTTLTELQGVIDAVSGIDVTAARDLPDNLELDLHIQRTATISVPVNSAFGPLHLTTSGTLDLSVLLDFQLTLGARYAGTAATPYIKADNDQLQVTATLTGTNLAAAAQLGFVDVNVANGSAALVAHFTMDLADPGTGANADGQITFAELNATPVTSLVTTSLDSPTAASLSMDITSSLISGTRTLQVQWSDINDVTSATSNIGSLGDYQALEQLASSVISGGLTDFSTWTGFANNMTLLGRPLPVIGSALTDAVDLPNRLKSILVNQVGSYATAQRLRTQLENVGAISGVNVALNAGVLTYTFALDSTFSRNVPVELGMSSIFDLSVDAQLNLSGHVAGNLSFGVNLADQTFFVATGDDPDLTISAKVDAKNVNASAGVGFLSAEINNGTLALDASVNLSLHDPSGDGKITASDQLGGISTIHEFVGVDFGGSASIALPISAPSLGFAEHTFTAELAEPERPGDLHEQRGRLRRADRLPQHHARDVQLRHQPAWQLPGEPGGQ